METFVEGVHDSCCPAGDDNEEARTEGKVRTSSSLTGGLTEACFARKSCLDLADWAIDGADLTRSLSGGREADVGDESV